MIRLRGAPACCWDVKKERKQASKKKKKKKKEKIAVHEHLTINPFMRQSHRLFMVSSSRTKKQTNQKQNKTISFTPLRSKCRWMAFPILGFTFRIGNANGSYEDLLTPVKRLKLKWYEHVRRSSGTGQDYPTGNSTRRETKRQTEETMGRYRRVEWP